MGERGGGRGGVGGGVGEGRGRVGRVNYNPIDTKIG